MKVFVICFSILFLACATLAHAADDPIKPEDRTCTADSDCLVITISCNSCCPSYTLDETAAVNKDKAPFYADLGACTAQHNQTCGVPECGLNPNTPVPEAKCMNGTCSVLMKMPKTDGTDDQTGIPAFPDKMTP